MAVEYSPLCNTELSAYLAYCIASYGSSVGGVCPELGRGECSVDGGGCVDTVNDVGVVDWRRGGAWEPWIALLGRAGVGAGKGGVGSSGDSNGSEESGRAERVSADFVGGSSGSGGGCDSSSSPEWGSGWRSSAQCVSDAQVLGDAPVRGKHYVSNKRKRDLAKNRKRESIGGVSACPSLASVRTVDTRTAEELEAVRTFASRRAAENRVAEQLAKHRLESLQDSDKTEALRKLDVARVEQRINDAKAKSQASYKKCDESLKSLGSTGSAGEFALKREVKRGVEHKIRADYLEEQNVKMLRYMPQSVRDEIAAMAPPVYPTDEEVFGDCPNDWSDERRTQYWDDICEHDQELAVQSADYRVMW